VTPQYNTPLCLARPENDVSLKKTGKSKEREETETRTKKSMGPGKIQGGNNNSF